MRVLHVVDPTLARFLVASIGTRARGAIPNGTRVQKTASEDADTHRDGALATVRGSVEVPSDRPPRVGYLVEFDDCPDTVALVAEGRIVPV